MVLEWGTIAAVSLALIGALAAIYGRLSSVDTKVETIIERNQEDRAQHDKIWSRIDNHERRVTVLESRCPISHCTEPDVS